jgi:hypothetical protein
MLQPSACALSRTTPPPPPGFDPIRPQPTPGDPMLRASAEGRNLWTLRGAKPGSPTEPGFGLAGWNFAAPQLVIVSEWHSREPNDLRQAKPNPFWLTADC